jgi:anti-sigma factor RsiW
MIVASHVRALMAPQPFDVASSDRHTVKPWFNGRIADAPRVVDLADQGFPLVGGRVDVIGRAPVATLVYRHRQHLISLSAVPGGQAIAATPKDIGGYNLLSWSENGTAYSAVSDLAAADLETFAKAFRAASTER